jgi:hypothetical protein
MWNTYGKTRKPSICKGCGKEIKWVRGKGAGIKAVPVEPTGVYFLPDDDGTPFVMTDGNVRCGKPASDGILGYRKHVCAAFSPRPRSESELEQRRWA